MQCLSGWLHLSDQSVSVPDSSFAQDNCALQESKGKPRLKKYGLSFFCVCMYEHWTSPLAQRGQREGVVLLKSTTAICLSVICLAWLSPTQWWCWQNDRRGSTLQWMSILQQSTVSPWAPTHQQKLTGRELCFLKGMTLHLNIYIKHTGSLACRTSYTSLSLLLYKQTVHTLWVKLHPSNCN